MTSRPSIPAAIKRIVRKRSFFGCVFCGDMVYEYEHIEPYNVVNEHHEDNLVCLCVRCHREVTTGRRSKEDVVRAKRQPYSGQFGRDPRYSMKLSSTSRISLGSSTAFIDEGAKFPLFLVWLDQDNYISVKQEDGCPIFSAKISDISGKPALEILENEILVKKDHIWDATLVGTKFVAQYGSRRIFAKFDISQSSFHVHQLKCLSNAHGISITAEREVVFYGNEGSGLLGHNTVKHDGNFAPLFFYASQTAPGQKVYGLQNVGEIERKAMWTHVFNKR